VPTARGNGNTWQSCCWCGASQYHYPPRAAHTAGLAGILLLQTARLFLHQMSSHTGRSCTMCTDLGYSTMLRQLLHRPQRPHSTALAALRAIGRATSEVGTGPVHLASDRATIAPTTRHPGQQLAVTATLGKAAAGVAPTSTVQLFTRGDPHAQADRRTSTADGKADSAPNI
jgi:hypothetical protein